MEPVGGAILQIRRSPLPRFPLRSRRQKFRGLDTVALRLAGGTVGDVPQGGTRLAVTSHRTVVTPAILGPVSTVPPERRRRGHLWPRGSAPALAGILEVWQEHPGDETRVTRGSCGRAS